MTIQATEGPVVDTPPRTLADLRRAAGLSQSQVAARMGLQRQRIVNIEATYPKINYGTLARYIQALGGSINFTVGTIHASADQLEPDPEKQGTREYLESRPSMGKLTYTPSAAKELVLEGEQPHTSSDHSGGQVDHADPESDQSDSGQRQQP